MRASIGGTREPVGPLDPGSSGQWLHQLGWGHFSISHLPGPSKLGVHMRALESRAPGAGGGLCGGLVTVWGQFQRWVQEHLWQVRGGHWKESCSHAQGTGAAALPLAVLCFDAVTTHMGTHTHTGTRTHMGTHRGLNTEPYPPTHVHQHGSTPVDPCPQMSRLLPDSENTAEACQRRDSRHPSL